MQLSHTFSLFSVCSYDYSMNPYVYPAGPCRPTVSLADQYGTNTGHVEPTSMGGIWTTHDSLWAQNRRKPVSESSTCSSFTHGLYGPIRVQQSSNNRSNPHRGHPPSLIRVFAMRLIGKQGHKASSYEHAISVLSCTLIHILQLLRIFTTIVCLHVLKQT